MFVKSINCKVTSPLFVCLLFVLLNFCCFFFSFILHLNLSCKFVTAFPSFPMTAWRACLGKIRRKEMVQLYKVKIMRPDGSVILGRCDEPRGVIQLPVDVRTLSDEERRMRIAERKPAAVKIVEDTLDDTYDFHKYVSQWK